VQAGLDVVGAGGSAVDGAIAAMVVAMSSEPGVVSPLGGAFVSVWPVDGEPEVVDGNVEMPGRGLPAERFGQGLREVTTAYGGGLTMYAGHGSVATPGAFAALGLAHRRHGRVPWAEVMQPAVELCRGGYHLGSAASGYLAVTGQSVFAWDAETAALLGGPDGTPLRTGDVVVDPNLADALAHIGQAGPGDLYTGDIAERIAADMSERGGLVTAEDLAAYRAVLRPALRLRAGDWDLATNPPPSVGGPLLSVMLGELVRRGRFAWADVIEIQRTVLSYRHRVHDHSVDLERDGRTLLELVRTRGLAGLSTSSSTAHVSVVDADGMACAITASAGYGSGATVPGTGLLLNNSLGEPELNRRGLHVLEPGTRLASNMAPSVGRASAGRALAIGSPGADRITTALMQVLARHALLGTGLQEAIDAPRVHIRVLDDGSVRAEVEQDAELEEAAAQAGLAAVVHPRGSMFFGGVGAAHRGPDGSLGAAADGRRAAATGTA